MSWLFNSPYIFCFCFSWTPDGQRTCSCYTFENGTTSGMSWLKANDSCTDNKKHLVVLETVHEWEFINRSIKDRRTTDLSDEWHIGLFKNMTTGNWTWVNGKPLTIDKWQPHKPDKPDYYYSNSVKIILKYALIAKNYPPGQYGTFNSVGRNVFRGWICEEETGLNMLLFPHIS